LKEFNARLEEVSEDLCPDIFSSQLLKPESRNYYTSNLISFWSWEFLIRGFLYLFDAREPKWFAFSEFLRAALFSFLDLLFESGEDSRILR